MDSVVTLVGKSSCGLCQEVTSKSKKMLLNAISLARYNAEVLKSLKHHFWEENVI